MVSIKNICYSLDRSCKVIVKAKPHYAVWPFSLQEFVFEIVLFLFILKPLRALEHAPHSPLESLVTPNGRPDAGGEVATQEAGALGEALGLGVLGLVVGDAVDDDRGVGGGVGAGVV